MFKTYWEYLDFIEKLKYSGYKIEEYSNCCVVKSCGYAIARLDMEDIEIIDVHDLLFSNEEYDNLPFGEVLYEYNKFINFILMNMTYKGSGSKK